MREKLRTCDCIVCKLLQFNFFDIIIILDLIVVGLLIDHIVFNFYFILHLFPFFILPLFLFLIYDCIFLEVIFPKIKKFILGKVKITIYQTDFDFLFMPKADLEENTIILTFPKTVPDISDNNYFIKKLKSYIWLCKFYQKHGEIKYYLLPFLVIGSHTIFFILSYIYLFNCNKSLYLLVFMLLWLFYSIYNIEDILNLKKYNAYFKKFKEDINFRQYFRHLNIIVIENKIPKGADPDYFKNIEFDYERYYKQKMDAIIGFISTVIFIGLLTYVVASSDTSYKVPRGDKNESNVSCINRVIN